MVLHGYREQRGCSSMKPAVEMRSTRSHQLPIRRKTPLNHHKHNKRKSNVLTFPITTFLPLLLIALITTSNNVYAQDEIPDTDNYCGESWVDAANLCSTPCPNLDADCTTPGHSCQQFTGCQAKLRLTYPPTFSPTSTPSVTWPRTRAITASSPTSRCLRSPC